MGGVKFGEQLLELQPNLPIILTTGFSGFLTEGKVRAPGFGELLNIPSIIQTLRRFAKPSMRFAPDRQR
jgi:hypothetical protein